MMKSIRPIFLGTIAVFMMGGSILGVRANSLNPPGLVQLAQMNSPGDGLDGRRAMQEGNARPRRLGGMGYGRVNRLHLRRYRYHGLRHDRRYR